MSRRTLRSPASGALLPLAGFAVVAYFVWHGLNGAYGLWASTQLEQESVRLESELSLLRTERERLQHHVRLLRPESLDPDMLEERARELLNHVHPHDVVIMERSD